MFDAIIGTVFYGTFLLDHDSKGQEYEKTAIPRLVRNPEKLKPLDEKGIAERVRHGGMPVWMIATDVFDTKEQEYGENRHTALRSESRNMKRNKRKGIADPVRHDGMPVWMIATDVFDTKNPEYGKNRHAVSNAAHCKTILQNKKG